MPNSVVFTNIPFRWGGRSPRTGMDCFTLASYIREQRRGQGFDFSKPEVVEAYAKHTGPDDARSLLLRLAKKLQVQRVSALEDGVITLIRGADQALCLGTVVGQSIIYMGSDGSVERATADFDGADIYAAFDAGRLC